MQVCPGSREALHVFRSAVLTRLTSRTRVAKCSGPSHQAPAPTPKSLAGCSRAESWSFLCVWGCGFRFSYIVSCFPRCMTMKRCTTTLSGSCHLPLPRLQTSDCNILYTATVSPSCRVQGLRVTASRVEGVAFGHLCYLKGPLS